MAAHPVILQANLPGEQRRGVATDARYQYHRATVERPNIAPAREMPLVDRLRPPGSRPGDIALQHDDGLDAAFLVINDC